MDARLIADNCIVFGMSCHFVPRPMVLEQEGTNMQPVSKGFYLGSIIGGWIAGLVLYGVGFAFLANEKPVGVLPMLLGN